MDENEKRLRECEPKATRAPWAVWMDHAKVYTTPLINTPQRIVSGGEVCECFGADASDDEGAADADAAFIAAARNAAPSMLRELDRLRAIEAAAKRYAEAKQEWVDRERDVVNATSQRKVDKALLVSMKAGKTSGDAEAALFALLTGPASADGGAE